MQDSKYLVPLAIVVAGVMIAGAIYLGGSKPSGNTYGTGDTAKTEVAPVTEKDHILGDRNADLVIVEYSDLECPFCKVFHNTMKEVVREYEGKVAWVYRHFPIAQLHAKAKTEAEATECAAEQGGNQMFWKYVDEVYATTNSNDSLDLGELPRIAEDLGLDVTAFNSCLSSGKYSKLIDRSVEEAVKAGARGTPYSIIIAKDGKQTIINGAEPLANVRVKIDALLK